MRTSPSAPTLAGPGGFCRAASSLRGERSLLRALVAVAFLLLSAVMIWGAFIMGSDTNEGALFVNLGTEIFGILITVALVEWLFERRRLQDRARELAWSIFHALERAVWVWQGGPRQLGTDALLGLIHGIRKNDPLPQFTRTLLVNLGTQSREALDKESMAIKLIPGMKGAVDDLTSLRALTDGDSAVSIRMVAEVLESGTLGLAKVLHLSTQPIPAALVRYRDSSERAQEERYYHGKGWTPRAQGGGASDAPGGATGIAGERERGVGEGSGGRAGSDGSPDIPPAGDERPRTA